MSTFHALDKTADAPFLRAGVADPLTRVAFRPTNRVARCATCGLVSLRETWEAVGGCPNGHDTMAPWDPRAALTAPGVGDGAVGAPPVAGPAPARRPSWVVPAALAALLAALVAALLLSGVLSRDDAPAPVETLETAVPTAPTPRAVEAGETTGELAAPDFKGTDGRYQDLYTFAADSSGRVLTVSLASTAFEPELSVETPSGERVRAEVLPVRQTDPDGLAPEQRVVVRDLRGPGLYRITVTSREADASGAYTLRVRQEEVVRPLTPNAAALQAELGQASPKVEGYYRDTYRFTAAAGREHTLRVGSSVFAPTLVVRGPGGGEVRGETGRAGGRLTFTFTPSAGGAHTVVVSSRERERKGAYTVGLAVEAPPRDDAADRPRDTGGAGSTTLRPDGSTLRDSLGAGQSRTFGLSGRVGDRVTIEVRTDGFTPRLTLVGPDGSRSAASGDGDRARLRATLPSGGRYRVEMSGSGAGRYAVTLDQQAAPTSDRIPRLPGQQPTQPDPEPAPEPAPAEGDTYRPAPLGTP